jgi:hypothetical protein
MMIISMNNVNRQCKVLLLLLAISLLGAMGGSADIWNDDYNREDYEEPAGASFAFLLNPSEDIWGIAIGSGTWLVNTPVFGDYFIRLFYNGLEETTYSGIGMTLRLMPHWRVAPFAGAGGSYNYALNRAEADSENGSLVVHGEDYSGAGTSYWGGHAEAGMRIWFNSRLQLLEVMGRYTWSSNDGDRDYWLIGISTGVGI